MGLQKWSKCGMRPAQLLRLALLWDLSLRFAFAVGDQWSTEVIPLVANVDTFGPLDTLMIWQMPDGPIKKVLVIFGGRDTHPYEYWDRSPSCPLCSGLPEKRNIVIDGLSRNYAVVVPESISPRGDWDSWPEDAPELQNIVLILSEWKRAHSLLNLSTVALGASAGGKCVSSLALRPGMFESVAVMISLGQRKVWEAVTADYPPTIFIYMPKDSKIRNAIEPLRKQLGSKGVPTEVATWHEHPITADWFAQLIPGLDMAISNAILQALIEHGVLDENRLIKTRPDGFRKEWAALLRELLRKVLPRDRKNPDRVMFEDSVLDEMNVAYAQHATFSRCDEEMFAWFEGGYNAQKSRAIF